ncbi:hypothetical protein K438DRAFT_1981985 [Mycena galopus ATCC 62051]|nr:hypothetical protein K438DRAFT_1997386 [Mycena galopus ATCC 62051]KAF8140883.1 hypothetical protein K438DRAFT_1995619 [Mycena galopus ATCC 62051]KAF8171564.1 hypothetical protein K438DRAFT_1981985 [Mycena galopus ATCC 62051]
MSDETNEDSQFITSIRQGKEPTLRNLGMGPISLLTENEELRHQIGVAHDIILARQAEARIAQLLLEMGEAHLKGREAEVRVAEAEVALATIRQGEARRRLKYFFRLKEVAKENLSDAQMQAAILHLEGREAGIESPEVISLCFQENGGRDQPADISLTLN